MYFTCIRIFSSSAWIWACILSLTCSLMRNSCSSSVFIVFSLLLDESMLIFSHDFHPRQNRPKMWLFLATFHFELSLPKLGSGQWKKRATNISQDSSLKGSTVGEKCKKCAITRQRLFHKRFSQMYLCFFDLSFSSTEYIYVKP